MRRGEALRDRVAQARPARGPLWVALVASAVGLVLSALLVRVHAEAHAGVTSFCTISETVNCDRVALSPYAVFLGIPVALWGVFGYSLAAALSLGGLRARERGVGWAGLLLAESAVAVAVSIVLAILSETRIHAICLLCAGSWLTSVVLLAAAWRACRVRGGAALGDGVELLRVHSGWTTAAVVVAIAVVAGAAYAFPRYWERPRSAAGSGGAGGATPAPPRGPGAPPATPPGADARVVIEYSDYECPYCARAHEETRQIREKRPDIRIVRRQFPLDMACNPAVKQSIHPSACALARVAICAGEQGRFEQMDDALFRNQREHLGMQELAQRAGVDFGKLQACIAAPETQRRLEADIVSALRDGVRATPTFVVGGVAKAGEFPWELVPPPPAPAGQAQGG